jgi:hypothetical protein
MIPVAIAPVIEHIGDVYAINEVTGKDFVKDPGLHRTMLGDGLACAVASLIGGPPVTTYSEVTGAVSLTKISDPAVLRIAALFGIFFSAVYLRTGNIWPLIIVHSLHDLLAFSASAGITAMGVGEFPDWTTGYLILIEAAMAVCGLYMLRKSKRAEIIELWDRKWSRSSNSRMI